MKDRMKDTSAVRNAAGGDQRCQLYTMIPLPLEALEVSGIDVGSIIRFTATSGKIIVEAIADPANHACSGDCDTCPVSNIPCYGQCDKCPCANGCRRRKGVW